jgi:hypothetical protein
MFDEKDLVKNTRFRRILSIKKGDVKKKLIYKT